MKKIELPSASAGLTLTVFCILFGSIGIFTPRAASEAASRQFSANITAFARGSNAIIYHASSNKIYASLPSSTDASGNSIARIDPDTGAIEQTLWVGSEPDKLVLAADGTTLYVKLRGARAIRKVDLATFTAGPQFQAGLSTLYGPHQVVDFDVSGSDPNLVAVSRDSEGFSGPRGVAIFDSGVQRPTAGGSSGALAFSGSASVLFGNSYYGGELEKMTLTPSGVGSVSTTTGAGGSRLQLVNGRLYTSYGKVLDAATGNLLGTFSFSDPIERPFFVDAANHKIFFVERTYQGIEIRCFDIDTFVPDGTVLLPNVPGVPRNVARWGTNGLAISTPDAHTYFVKSDLVGPGPIGPAAPTPTPVPVPYSPAFVRRVDIKNNYIAYNELDQKIYASVPSSGGPGLGNTITRIDPLTGSTVSSVFIGSEPKHLEVSNDGSAVYVGLSGAHAVRRFDTATQTAGLPFTPTPGNYISDIAVSPADPGTVVVASGGAMGIYDNGVKRPITLNAGVSWVAYNGTPDVVYAIDGTSFSSFYKLGITPTSIIVLSDVRGVLNPARDVRFAGGRMYASDGRVVDPETNHILGRFNVSGSVAWGDSVVVDPELGRAFVLSRDELAAFDINSFNKIGSIPNPVTSSTSYEPPTLVRWGANGLAFRNRTSGSTPTDQIYLIQTSLVSSNGIIPTGYYLAGPTLGVGEGWGSASLIITRTGDLYAPASIDYATANGTATSGSDYVAVSGTAVFAPGESTKTINVPLIEDDVYEGSETFTFTLSNPTGTNAQVMNPGAATVTLSDNEGPPWFGIYAETVSEPPLGVTKTVNITVVLSNNSSLPVTVDFATANGTATAGSDYISNSGTLTFSPTETSKVVPVQILGDSITEPDERFSINLSNPTNATIPYPQEFVTIRNLNNAARFDFDGDGRTDIGIFRPNAAGEWWINRSTTGQTFALQFGASTDKIAPADYTGDGKADIAFFRPSSGEWYVLRSEDFSFFALPFGTNGDVPVPADYDADGKADFAVFRPSNATWFISQSSGAPTRIEQFGANGDHPVVSDYDGDGKADVGIFRPAATGAEWWINRSTAGVLAMQFGASTDKPAQGDYTGDGKTDIAIWRPSTGEWLIVRSEDLSFYGFPFGANGDVIAPGDYDGDGKFDPTVFRPSSATWFIARTTAGTQIVQFGANGDKPVPNAFLP